MWTGHTSLLTAHIIYRRPDRLWLLQEFIFQHLDMYPEFPALIKFLRFWQDHLDGPIHSVSVSHCRLGRSDVIFDLHDFDFKGQKLQ